MNRNLNHCKFAAMTIEEANRLLIAAVTDLYDEREAASISALVMERVTGIRPAARLLQKKNLLESDQLVLLQHYLTDLLGYRPVQYVLGEAWFGPYAFYVDENVLIPRPETEELASWVLEGARSQEQASVLDIGTGSGCIPVFLKKKNPGFTVSAMDVSPGALAVARRNGSTHDAAINWILADVLDQSQWKSLPSVDIMISNPPYIPEQQKIELEKHVKNFEPALALFVPDADPIVFYKAIAALASLKLNTGGYIYLEIHHDFARAVTDWYREHDFLVELKKDFSGKNRMIRAIRR